MNLSSLRNFIVIAHCGGFTKAAEQLLVSQPTLSRQIRELEEELGVQLFERNRSGLQITDAGTLALEEAIEIVDRCDRLPKLFRPDEERKARRTIREVLRIGCQYFLDTEGVYRAIAEVRREAPDSEVMLHQGNVPELKQGLMNNRFDAVFSLQIYYESIPGVKTLPFLANRLQVVVSDRHPMAERESVKLRELKDEPFILLQREYSPIVVDYLIAGCVNNGFSPEVSHYVSNGEEGLRLAAAGEGIAFLASRMRMEGMESRYHVRFLELEEKEANLPLVIAYREKNPKYTLRRLIGALELE